MSKKDYTRIAQALKDSKPDQKEADRLWVGAIFEWQNVVQTVAFTLQSDNPRFNRAKFLQACGYEG